MTLLGVTVSRELIDDLGQRLSETGAGITAIILTRANRSDAASVQLSRLDRENVLAALAIGAPDGLQELRTELLRSQDAGGANTPGYGALA